MPSNISEQWGGMPLHSPCDPPPRSVSPCLHAEGLHRNSSASTYADWADGSIWMYFGMCEVQWHDSTVFLSTVMPANEWKLNQISFICDMHIVLTSFRESVTRADEWEVNPDLESLSGDPVLYIPKFALKWRNSSAVFRGQLESSILYKIEFSLMFYFCCCPHYFRPAFDTVMQLTCLKRGAIETKCI